MSYINPVDKNKENSYLFSKNGYVKVSNALTQNEANILANAIYFDSISNPNIKNDIISPPTQVGYANPITESLLVAMHHTVELATGLTLLPTYSYHRLYKTGDYLKKHKDRFACEISATVNLGCFYNTDDKNYSWNIWVDGKENITLPGDMVVYKGVSLEHWREPFDAPIGSWQAQAFLHYVDVNGQYADFALDGRPGIGYPDKYSKVPDGRKYWHD
jgi:hypothetical protein